MRSILAAIVSLGLIGSAQADVETVFSKDFWHLTLGTVENGDGVCIAETGGEDKGRYFNVSLRVFSGNTDVLQIWVIQEGWKIPETVETPVKVEFDQLGAWEFPMVSYEEGGDILWSILQGEDKQRLFYEEFVESSEMVITFEGTERPWRLGMDGSAAVLMKFKECVELLEQVPTTPTQPFDQGTESTQPFAEPTGPSQPFKT